MDNAAIRIGVRGLRGKRLVCHCRRHEACQGDILLQMAEDDNRQPPATLEPAQDLTAPPVYSPAALAEMAKVGRGPPLMKSRKGSQAHVVDGSGTCSPGKWRPADRLHSNRTLAAQLRSLLMTGTKKWAAAAGGSTRDLVMSLASSSSYAKDPPPAVIDELAASLHRVVVSAGP